VPGAADPPARRCPYEAALALADAPDETALRDALNILADLGARPRSGSPADAC
jgi:hypothetical protein